MHIVGITCSAKDGTPLTILVRSSVSVLNVTICSRVLPWFFCQDIPLYGIINENSDAIRVRSDVDPFRHLRRGKNISPFDGKGFTIQRSLRHEGILRIDGAIKLPIDEFNLLCPGLFYGTAMYPNLNLLVSKRVFRKNVNPERLWCIMHECLLLRQFTERQQKEGEFKLEMRRKYMATQLKDFRPRIAELEERLKETKNYDQLRSSLREMIATVHSRQAARHTEEVAHLKRLARSVRIEKEELTTSRLSRDIETTETTVAEIIATSIGVSVNELVNMQDRFEKELFELRSQLESMHSVKLVLQELCVNVEEVEKTFHKLQETDTLAVELQTAQCLSENNASLLLFSKLSDPKDKEEYISNLQKHATSLQIDIQCAEQEETKVENEMRKIIVELLQAKKRSRKATTSNNDPQLNEMLKRLTKNISEIVEATNALSKHEENALKIRQKIWEEYSNISSIPFAELVSIAVVNVVIEKMHHSALPLDFVGFIYDCALESGACTEWLDGFSSTAIFATQEGATRVKQRIEELREGIQFQYVVLSRQGRNSVHNFILENVPKLRDNVRAVDYGELVRKVNRVVRSVMVKFQLADRLQLTRARLERLLASKEECLAALDAERIKQGEKCSVPCPTSVIIIDFPTLMQRFIKIKCDKETLETRLKSLHEFALQLQSNEPLPTEEQLKSEGVRLLERYNIVREKKALHYKKEVLHGFKNFDEACKKLEFTLNRWNVQVECVTMDDPSTIQQLIDCWTTCSACIRRGLEELETVQSKFKASVEEAPIPAADAALDEQMQSLQLRENSITTRIATAESRLAEYRQEYAMAMEQSGSKYSTPSCTVGELNKLVSKIEHGMKRLQQMPPGCKSSEVVKMKAKLKHVQLLEKIRLDTREMCLNNIILPVIDKLYVQKLRQITHQVLLMSDDLPELGGTARLAFGCQTRDAEQAEDEAKPFDLSEMCSLKIHIIDNGKEIEMDQRQHALAYLILYMAFLNNDNCKLLILDKSLEDLFDNGVVGLFSVLTKYCPSMQIIVLDGNHQRPQ